MKKATKVILIVATSCLVLGMALSGIAYGLAGFNLTNLSTTPEYRKESYTSEQENYQQFIYTGLDDDVTVERHSGEKIEVEYYENDQRRFEISDSDGMLKIEQVFEPYLSFYNFEVFSERGTTIKIPQTYEGSFDVSSASGNVTLNGLSKVESLNASSMSGSVSIHGLIAAQDVFVSSTSGYTVLNSIEAQNIDVSTMSGSCMLESVTAALSLNANSTSGDVDVTDVRSQVMNLSSMSGYLRGARVSASSLTADSTSGTVSMQLSSLETLVVTTMSGDIEFLISGPAGDYRIETSSMSGRINAPAGSMGATKSIEANSTSGNIDLSFVDFE